MIFYKTWHKKKRKYSYRYRYGYEYGYYEYDYEGWFLLGFIPLYIKRIVAKD